MLNKYTFARGKIWKTCLARRNVSDTENPYGFISVAISCRRIYRNPATSILFHCSNEELSPTS